MNTTNNTLKMFQNIYNKITNSNVACPDIEIGYVIELMVEELAVNIEEQNSITEADSKFIAHCILTNKIDTSHFTRHSFDDEDFDSYCYEADKYYDKNPEAEMFEFDKIKQEEHITRLLNNNILSRDENNNLIISSTIKV